MAILRHVFWNSITNCRIEATGELKSMVKGDRKLDQEGGTVPGVTRLAGLSWAVLGGHGGWMC